jgi:hypothetical protein
MNSSNEDERCPMCGSDEVPIQSMRDRFPLRQQPSTEEPLRRPVARGFWLKCEDCGYDWFFLRKLK